MPIFTVESVQLECYKCHIIFAVPKEFNDAKLTHRHDRQCNEFFCPAGHGQVYAGKTEAQKLAESVAFEKQQREAAEARERRKEYQLRALKGAVTRAKNRRKK